MRKFIKGNNAVTIGALYAGCEIYFGYPITPASEIAHSAAELFPQRGKTFLQAECETGAINMIYGAASSGRMSMTASSGPGMSLMCEGISYLAGAQLPAVIVDVQRAGPGLGNIGPEQGDYNQAVKGGGHGNYKAIVLAPSSVQEMCDLTIKAFELAYKYRNPAIVFTDAVLGQVMESLEIPEEEFTPPDVSDWAVQGDNATRENLVSSIYLQNDLQEKHNWLLDAKYASMSVDAASETYLSEDAEVLLTGYGSCSRIARSAVDALRANGIKAGLFRPITLFPFPEKELQKAAKGKKILVVELSNGQYRDDVILHLDRKNYVPVELINRMGGNLVTTEEVVAAAVKLLEAGE
ncbi:MAG: 3-methyl-2-oxobutanoate dehydrogenase subunit VorB [Desulforhopalus sp.]